MGLVSLESGPVAGPTGSHFCFHENLVPTSSLSRGLGEAASSGKDSGYEARDVKNQGLCRMSSRKLAAVITTPSGSQG